MIRRTLVRFGAAATLLGSTVLGAQTPSHVYTLNGTLADANGGPSLVAINSVMSTMLGGANGYSFTQGSGFSLSNALANPSVYSIELRFLFDNTSGYRRIVDFKDRALDQGFYNLNTAENYFPVTTGPAGAFADGVPLTVVITRDASDVFSGYANGILQISFIDGSGLATFTGPNNIINFFVDDFAVGGEASSGFADYIRTYDQALTAQQVGALAPPTTAAPEPATLALLGTGLLALGSIARRRRSAA